MSFRLDNALRAYIITAFEYSFAVANGRKKICWNNGNLYSTRKKKSNEMVVLKRRQ